MARVHSLSFSQSPYKIRPTYRQYERKRLGGHGESLRGLAYMFRQSFMAPTFARFWQQWNPLFSYYLLYFCYLPLRPLVKRGPAVVLTFAATGAVHDLAASLAWRELVFICTPLFALFGGYLLVEAKLGWHLGGWPGWLRPAYHLLLMAGWYGLVSWWLKS
ncbi:MAG: hypothetical protein KDC54_06420 [Lewinella sp.]|nr:hypothetical protein [Lewinella sp.]